MKRTARRIICIMVFGLLLLPALQAPAAQGEGPAGFRGMTTGAGSGTGDVEPQPMTPWVGMRGHWTKVPRTLMGKIYLWERYLIGHRNFLLLTEQQVDEIGSALNTQRKYWIGKDADRRVLIIEIEELLAKGPADLAKVEEKVKAVQALSADIAMEEIRTLEKVLSILTPQQRKAAEEFMRETTFTRTIRAY